MYTYYFSASSSRIASTTAQNWCCISLRNSQLCNISQSQIKDALLEAITFWSQLAVFQQCGFSAKARLLTQKIHQAVSFNQSSQCAERVLALLSILYRSAQVSEGHFEVARLEGGLGRSLIKNTFINFCRSETADCPLVYSPVFHTFNTASQPELEEPVPLVFVLLTQLRVRENTLTWYSLPQTLVGKKCHFYS